MICCIYSILDLILFNQETKTNEKKAYCLQVLFSPKLASSKLCLKSCCPPDKEAGFQIKERTRPIKDKTSMGQHPSIGAKRSVGSTNFARTSFLNIARKMADAGKVERLPQFAEFSSKKSLEAANTKETIGLSSKNLLKPKACGSTVDVPKSGWGGPDWQWVMGEILKRERIRWKIQEMEEILKMDGILRPFTESTWRRAMGTRMRIRFKRNTAGKI